MTQVRLNVREECVRYPITISTTSLAKVRGFTVQLLFCLLDTPKRCCELVEITGKEHRYLWRYLKNMENYGLVLKDGVYWKLTDLGAVFAQYLDKVYSKIYEYRKKVERIQKEHRKNVERKKKEKETSHQQISSQLSIAPWVRDSNPADAARVVVGVLVDHYNRTGSKFILVRDQYELAERCGLNPEALRQALKKLHEDRVVYVWHWKAEGVFKVGLYKAFVEALENATTSYNAS